MTRNVAIDLTKYANGKEVGELTITVKACECLMGDLAMAIEAQLNEVAKGQKQRVRKPCGCGGKKSQSTV